MKIRNDIAESGFLPRNALFFLFPVLKRTATAEIARRPLRPRSFREDANRPRRKPKPPTDASWRLRGSEAIRQRVDERNEKNRHEIQKAWRKNTNDSPGQGTGGAGTGVALPFRSAGQRRRMLPIGLTRAAYVRRRTRDWQIGSPLLRPNRPCTCIQRQIVTRGKNTTAPSPTPVPGLVARSNWRLAVNLCARADMTG